MSKIFQDSSNEDEKKLMRKYRDPSNWTEVKSRVEKLASAKDHVGVEALIKEIFPGWIMFDTTEYSADYPHLTRNWEIICENSGTVPRKILLVEYINFSPDFKLLNYFGEVMTKAGYAVRRNGEFVWCNVCNKAIPCEEVWAMLREKRFPVPETWSDVCTTHR